MSPTAGYSRVLTFDIQLMLPLFGMMDERNLENSIYCVFSLKINLFKNLNIVFFQT